MQIMILKVFDYYGEYGEFSHVVNNCPEWVEVDLKKHAEIRQSVSYANMNVQDAYRFVIIEKSDDNFLIEIDQNAVEFHRKIEERRKAEAVRKAADKKKRDATKMVRKRKQLDALKKELGDT